MNRLIKYLPALLPLTLFTFALAGPYPGSIRDHGHTGPGDGGILANPKITNLTTQINNSTFTGVMLGTFSTSGLTSINNGNVGMFRNKIINGQMWFKNRNQQSVASQVTSNNYVPTETLNKWIVLGATSANHIANIRQLSTSTTLGINGFTQVLKISPTSLTEGVGPGEYSILYQVIDGFNAQDLKWGTQSASTITLSFYLYYDLGGNRNITSTDTYGGFILNEAQNRSYPFKYTLTSSTTWNQVSVVIPGDTGGTWTNTINSTGLIVGLALGVGSNFYGSSNTWNAGLYYDSTGTNHLVDRYNSSIGNTDAVWITGVQLEKGNLATTFEQRPPQIEASLLYSPEGIEAINISSGSEIHNLPTSLIGSTFAATAGYIGEILSTQTTTLTSVSTTGAFGDLLSMSVSPGIWIFSWNVYYTANGGTVTGCAAGINQNSGFSGSGLIEGDNYTHTAIPTAATDENSVGSNYGPITLSTATTFYLKKWCAFTVATPKCQGRMNALRIH